MAAPVMSSSDIPPHDVEDGPIGLRHYLDVIWRRKLTLLLVAAICVGTAAALTFTQESKYAAETTIVVGQAGGLVQPQNANAIQPFSATMTELINSTVVAEAVTSQLGLRVSPEKLLDKISVSFNPESAALKVRVVDPVPARAQAIARQIGVVFSDLVEERFATTAPGTTDGSVGSAPLTATVWDPAHALPGRVQPQPAQNLVIASLLGLILGLLAAFLRDYFDRRLHDTAQIERAFGIPVIGQIPSMPKRSRKLSTIWYDDHGELAEAFRTLRANLQYVGLNKPLRTLLITSPGPGQGKTTVCANLTMALAQSDSSVVAIETDLRRPVLSSLFGIRSSSIGLTNVLVGSDNLAETLHRLDLPMHGGMGEGTKQVSVLASGPLPPNPSEILASSQMSKLVEGLAHSFDYVLLDSPPILFMADTLELAKLADGVILVVRSTTATKDEARDLRNLAQRLAINLVGIVVTDVRVRSNYDYSAYKADAPRGRKAQRLEQRAAAERDEALGVRRR